MKISSDNINFNDDPTPEVKLHRLIDDVLPTEKMTDNSVLDSQIEYLLRKIIEMQNSTGPPVQPVIRP